MLKYRVRRSVADDLDASGDNLASRATVLNEARKLAAADAAQAHALMESNAHIGKIMLTWPVDAEGSAA
mgnify:CR=1 FL=1